MARGQEEAAELQAAESEKSMLTSIPFLVLRITQTRRWDRDYYCVHLLELRAGKQLA